MDKIILEEMQFYGYHGLFAEENKLGQRFNVTIELFIPLKRASITDDMNDSVNYGEVFDTVKDIVEGEPKSLIEAVAGTVADSLLEKFMLLDACLVKVTKPDPPIRGHYKSVAVQIYRERE